MTLPASPSQATSPSQAPRTSTSEHDALLHSSSQSNHNRHNILNYIRTRHFWLTLLLGQLLALCITAANTFSQLLANKHTNIPAFQTILPYILLNLIYTTTTISRYGIHRWLSLLRTDSWRYILLAILDVEGNYCTVRAYRYTTILSAQLVNFWAVVVVVVVSLTVLRVRYHATQYLGIIICLAGMILLLLSDRVTGHDGGAASHAFKGDLLALVGATFYGLSNVFEEFLVSQRPLYEVLGQLAFWALPLNAVQALLLDRADLQSAVWDAQVTGYLFGFTLALTLFYSLVPIMLRFSSAAFFNISLLTGNFWGVMIGTLLFGLTVHHLYPIAFVLILIGLVVYFLTESVLGEAYKPWLGADQRRGVEGVGTARRRVRYLADEPAASDAIGAGTA